MLSSLTLNDASGAEVTLHQTTKRQVTKVTGLVGISSVRRSTRVRPSADGAIDESKYLDEKVVTIEGETYSNISQADAYTEFRAIAKALRETLSSGPALLKWTEGVSGNQLQRLVKLASECEPVLSEGAAILSYDVELAAEDPRAYDQTLTTVSSGSLSSAGGGRVYPKRYNFTYSQSSGGTVNVTTTGNEPTPPTFRIYGYALNPQIVNLDTGDRISLIGTVGPGDYLELDSAARTLELNGVTSRAGFLDAANTSWFELPAATTTHLQLVASDFDGVARLDVLYRNATA